MSTLSGTGLLSSVLTSQQAALVESPVGEPQSLFLEGPAGAGKTTAAVCRLLRLLAAGLSADSILVLVPQRTLARAYLDALRSPQAPPGVRVDVLTIGGLAQRAVELYWPLVARAAGFAHPDQPPTFLTLETAQYYMDRLVAPYVEQGAFGDVTLSRPRLISQVLDNLNKAAVVRFPHSEIGQRLAMAWSGESSRLRVYEQVQACAAEFRRLCLEHNLLDFSLQIETFATYVLALPQAASALRARYRHLLADNIEEDVPLAHDLLTDWLPACDSAWLIYDDEGGLRTYLGADPAGAHALHERCRAHERWDQSLVNGPPLLALAAGIAHSLGFHARSEARSAHVSAPSPTNPSAPEARSAHVSAPSPTNPSAPLPSAPEARSAHVSAPSPTNPSAPAVSALPLVVLQRTFHTEVIAAVGDEIASLVHGQGTPPGEIAVLAPFMSDALRFSLSQALERQGVASYSQRPSRALADEPAARSLLTLAKLAHPVWGLLPPRADVAHALVATIAEMDLVRAWHLAAIVYRPPKHGAPGGAPPILAGFEQIRAEEQLRITYLLGGRYDALRQWLAAYAEGPQLPLDHFLSRLFDEVLSQPGYRFRADRDAAAATAHLIASAFRFRQTVERRSSRAATGRFRLPGTGRPTGEVALGAPGDNLTDVPGDGELSAASFVALVEQGAIAAQYLPPDPNPQAVLLAPAYTFVMANRPVEVQFWLDLASSSWGRRLYQPLTHPYVLTRGWPEGRAWTDADEDLSNRQGLYRLALALIRRCRRCIYLADSTYNERGFEEHGPLQQAIFRTLRRAALSEAGHE